MLVKIKVSTPKGQKFHGMFDTGRKTFSRMLKFSKDAMHKYNAWSVHPEIVDRMKSDSIQWIEIYDCESQRTYLISNRKALNNGFMATHRGGETFYIPIKHWQEV